LNVGIIGVGGVGGYFGGKLCKFADTHRASVHFIARGDHLTAIRSDGIYVSTSGEGDWICKPASVTDDFEALPVLDVCLLCVKSYDLSDVLFRVRDRICDDTLILPLLNGVDVYERIREIITTAGVFPACVYIGTHIEAPGRVIQKGGACTIHFCRDPEKSGRVPKTIFDLFDTSGIRYKWYDSDYTEIWRKFIFIASFGLVTAVYGKTLGEVLESRELKEQVASVMHEIVDISQNNGIKLSGNEVRDALLNAENFPYGTKTSFQRDFQRREKPDERDLFGGTILRLALQTGSKAPVTEQLYKRLNEIKPLPDS